MISTPSSARSSKTFIAVEGFWVFLDFIFDNKPSLLNKISANCWLDAMLNSWLASWWISLVSWLIFRENSCDKFWIFSKLILMPLFSIFANRLLIDSNL